MFSCVNHFHILSNPDASPYFLNILLVPPILFRLSQLIAFRNNERPGLGGPGLAPDQWMSVRWVGFF